MPHWERARLQAAAPLATVATVGVRQHNLIKLDPMMMMMTIMMMKRKKEKKMMMMRMVMMMMMLMLTMPTILMMAIVPVQEAA